MSHGHSGHDGDGHGHAHADLEQPLLPTSKGDDHGHAHGGGGCSGHGGHDDHGKADAGHGHAHGGGGGGCSGHGHGEEKSDDDIKALQTAVYLALFFMTVELFGGYFANSLAIMTDAAHMLSDVGGFIISLMGMKLAQMMATEEYTYGFKQAEVLGAFLSILIVWALTAVLLYQAVIRFQNPEAIDAPVMFVISVIGFLVNLVLMKVLGHNHSHAHGGGHDHGEEGENIAIKAAVAHVIGDIVQSLGVCLAATLIWWQPIDIGQTENGVTNWVYADPMCTVLFGVMVLHTTKDTIIFALNTLMVKAPSHVNQSLFLENLGKIKSVESVHDLHVWSMGSKETLCTAHVMIRGVTNQTRVLQECIQNAKDAGISHSTFQIEISGEFDPAIESYGGLGCNPNKGGNGGHGGDDHGHDHGHAHGGAKEEHGHGHDGAKEEHGHGHDGAKDSGHAHDGGGCCGGHDNDGDGGHAAHGDGGHGGHGGHADHGH